jgi:hypothetical protein
MPFTLFHLGVAFLTQSLFILLDPIGLFVGSVFPDIEGFLSIVLPGSGIPLHGRWHSIIGAVVLAIIIGSISFVLHKVGRKQLKPYIKPYVPSYITIPRYSLPLCVLSALVGTLTHLFLDSLLYTDMKLFYWLPIEGNPLAGYISWEIVYFFCIICFIIGAAVFFGRYRVLIEENS